MKTLRNDIMKGERTNHNCLPNKEVHHFNTMIQLMELKKLNKAFKICEQILKKYPKNGETLSAKAYILNLMDENNKEDAFKFAKEGIRNNISSCFCWYILGCLNKKHKNYEEALKCFMQAIKFNPSDQKSLRETCLSLLFLKKFDQFKELRWNIYKNSFKTIRDKSTLLFSFHLAKDYNGCLLIIKEIETDLAIHHDLKEEEKNDFLTYISEILLEAEQYDECIRFVRKYDKDLLETSWCFQILGVAYLYKDWFSKANYYFKKCFELNQENLIILLLMLFTERSYYIGNENEEYENIDETEENKEDKDKEKEKEKEMNGRKTLADLFYLDYKMQHKESTKVNISEHVKVLIHECILDMYGPDKNMKFMSEKRKNVLNDYICHNLRMDKYDVYTCTELENLINKNCIEKKKFVNDLNLDSDTGIDVDTFIEMLRKIVEEEGTKDEMEKEKNHETEKGKKEEQTDETTNMEQEKSVENIENYNNIIWSKKLGTDFTYICKKRVDKCSDIRYLYKIKNLDEEEELSLEKYFSNLQNVYTKSNLVKLFPLHFYSEKKFAFHVEKIIRSFFFKQKITVFQYIKSMLTFKNIRILLFILKKYISHYDATGELCYLGGIQDTVKEKNNKETEEKEKTEIEIEKDTEKKTNMKREESYQNHDNDKNYLEKREDSATDFEKKENVVDNVIKQEDVSKKKKEIKIIDMKSETEKEHEKLKNSLKKKKLNEEEKKEAFIACVYVLLSQLYDYINFPKEAIMCIDKVLRIIKCEANADFKMELIYIKGILYKKNGSYIEALKCLEKCRVECEDDRFINTKCCKVYFRCGFIKRGRKTATPFVNPGGGSFDPLIKDSQIFWLEHDIAMAYIFSHPNIHIYKYLHYFSKNKKNSELEGNTEIQENKNNAVSNDTIEDTKIQNKNSEQVNINIKALIEEEIMNRNKVDDYSRGLHLLHAQHKHYVDMCSDQATFYPYATRKLLFRSFLHLLHLTSKLYSCSFYRKIGKRIIRVLLDLHDYYKEMENEGVKVKKKKYKSFSDSTDDETAPYEYIKNDPLDNAMMYMETFLSQPNLDLAVYRLHYEIMRRRKINSFLNMIETLLTMKSIFTYHIYHYQIAPAISHFLYTVPISTLDVNVQTSIVTKLNELLNLKHTSYDEELLKQIRIDYLKKFIEFCIHYKKDDLSYFQAVLEAYINCEDTIDDSIFSNFKMDPKKNKMKRCFKFLAFLIKNERKYPEFTNMLKQFKMVCRETYPLATAFQ